MDTIGESNVTMKDFFKNRWPSAYEGLAAPKRRLRWFLIWRKAGLSISEEIKSRRSLQRARMYKKMISPARDAVKYVGTNPNEGLAQLATLIHHGCKETNSVLEIGCGALNAGYPIMQYLDCNKYFAVEPNDWLVKDSLKIPQVQETALKKNARFVHNAEFDASEFKMTFDYVISHSIISHAAHWQWPLFMENVSKVVKRGSKVLVSLHFTEGNKYGDVGYHGTELDFNEWVYPGISYFRKETIDNLAIKYGYDLKIDLVAPMLINMAHPGANHSWIILEKK
jgi:hypothetical protein